MAFKRIVANSEEDLKTIMNDIMNWFKETKDYKTEFSKEKRKFQNPETKEIVEKDIDVIKATDTSNDKFSTIKFIPMKEKGEMKVEIGGEGEAAVSGKITNQLKGKGKLKSYSKDKKVALKEDPKEEYNDLMSKIKSSFKHQVTGGKKGEPMSKGQKLTPNTKIKKSELKEIIKEEIRNILKEGFQGDEPEGDGLSGFRGADQIDKGDGMSGFRGSTNNSEEDEIFRKNREDILKLGAEGIRDFKRGIDLNYGPYKDQDSFEYMYWKNGWERAELANIIRKDKNK